MTTASPLEIAKARAEAIRSSIFSKPLAQRTWVEAQAFKDACAELDRLEAPAATPAWRVRLRALGITDDLASTPIDRHGSTTVAEAVASRWLAPEEAPAVIRRIALRHFTWWLGRVGALHLYPTGNGSIPRALRLGIVNAVVAFLGTQPRKRAA